MLHGMQNMVRSAGTKWLAAAALGCLAFGCLAYVAVAAPGAAAGKNSPLGHKVQDFSLRDFRGQEHQLSSLGDKKIVVLAFLGTECPLAKAYGPRLQKLAEEYADKGVAFLGINSNQQDLPTEIEAYARLHGVQFPLLKDAGNALADAVGAVRTPEVFVLDADRVVRYWGRVDDQFLVGSQRNEPQRRDLAIALDQLLAGQEVSTPVTQAPGCHIGRVAQVEPHGEVTWSNQISRLFQKRCVECHRQGEVAPFPLEQYSDVIGWGETIVEVTAQRRMPPWPASPQYGHFSNDASLSDEELQLIETWVRNGQPEGDKSQLPQPRQFAEGWRIGQPDDVFYIADEPYTVPAEGVVKYQFFTVDPGFTEDKWVTKAEARPDARSVVHHILAFIMPPGETNRELRIRAGAIGYAPGLPPTEFSDGIGMFVPAGSKIVFQMHYTPNGVEQKDRSSVGFVYADPQTIKRQVRGGMAANLSLEIPPGDNNHEVKSKYRFSRDTLIVNLTPHMHLRGKSFRFEAEYPGGQREILLDVPKYDFNWQLRYELAEPKLMPKGTWLRCTAHFDNSDENLANPDSSDTVRWGDQTWEEMMIGWFAAVSPEEDGPGM
ncbi:MAG: redoxin domain-containing protein [Pirellulales bacterium]